MASASPPLAGSPSAPRADSVRRRNWVSGTASVAVEIAIVAALLTLYRLGRTLASGRITEAEHNAASLWSLERSLHLVNEAHVQNLILHSQFLVEAANRYYVGVHFPITGLFLLWLFVRHRGSYYPVRNTLALLTFLGLIFTVTVPLAPPRLFTGDTLIDTMHVFGPSAYNPDSTTGEANQYAAMPSLHVAWAVLVAVAVVRISRRRVRWLAMLHPLITFFVVVATGNHYWLDGFVGLLLLGVSALFVYRMRWIRAFCAQLSGLSTYTAASGRLTSVRARLDRLWSDGRLFEGSREETASAVRRSVAIHRARRAVARALTGTGPPNR